MESKKRLEYTAKTAFLWYWKVVNEKGKTVHTGSKATCITMAQWLNMVFEAGYELGRVEGLHQVREELGIKDWRNN